MMSADDNCWIKAEATRCRLPLRPQAKMSLRYVRQGIKTRLQIYVKELNSIYGQATVYEVWTKDKTGSRCTLYLRLHRVFVDRHQLTEFLENYGCQFRKISLLSDSEMKEAIGRMNCFPMKVSL